MSNATLLQRYAQAPQQRKLQEVVAVSQSKTRLRGLTGSSLSFVLANTFISGNVPLLCIFNDKEEAAYYLNDLEQLVGMKDVLFYPGSYRRPYQIEETDNANVLLRAEVLNRISSRKKPAIIVTWPDALFEKVISRKTLKKTTLNITVNDTLSPDFVNEILFGYRFNRVDFVSEPGEFSVRGGIIDVFSFSNDHPYRIEFFDNAVESIRTFDVATQLSVKKVTRIAIIPNVENKLPEQSRESFLDYIPRTTLVFCKDPEVVSGRLNVLFEKAETAFTTLSGAIKHATPQKLFCDSGMMEKQLQMML